MTREDAVDWIRRLVATMKEETSGEFPEPEYKDDVYEALDMAIKALEQESCEDCISRAYIEPIIEELENICVNSDEHILNLLADIKNAPSVTPQPKTGHWIMKHRTHNEVKHYTGQDEMGEPVPYQFWRDMKLTNRTAPNVENLQEIHHRVIAVRVV